jgi:ATP-dependent helicase HrpB
VLPSPGTPGTDLPVRAALAELEGALREAGTAVLVAPPGTGKTSLVPLALAGLVAGRVVVAEPRRIAARAAARRMAALIGEPLGGRVGHTIRGESTVGPATRIEVVTTGVLVRRFQRDPELQGTDAVVLDECHERHLDTDLALAFGVDVRAALRPDLLLLAMSATAQSTALAAALGGAPVIETTGGLFDIATIWAPPSKPVTLAFGLRVDPALLDHVAGVIRRAFAEQVGDLLVFLPGTGEINRIADRLRDLPVVPLHGRLPAAAQDAALRAGEGRRIVLATSVAESSLTVPGVRVVVDAGLARVPRIDLGRGLGTLVTVPVSRASAHQRAGRAGREGPGVVYRCWSAAEHERLPPFPEPEISSADLTAFVLELAAWGAPGGRGLALLDPLPTGALTVATEALLGLQAIDNGGAVTPRGRQLTDAGVHPRLARALLDGAPLVGGRRAAEIVAVLSDDGLAGGTDDLAVALRGLRDGRDRAATGRWKAEVSRLSRSTQTSDVAADLAAGLVVGLAFPERIARLRQPGGRTYLMAGGTAAELAPGSALTGATWLAVAVADRAPGSRDARIRLAAVLDEQSALEVGGSLLRTLEEVLWEDGDVRARSREQLGAIVLRTRPLPTPDPEALTRALQTGVALEGLGLLRWTEGAQTLRLRLQALHLGCGAPWPDVSDEALLATLDLSAARSRADLQRLDLSRQLRALIPWSVAGLLDELAPERLTVPSGSAVRVDYTDAAAPTLAVKVQEVFGWTAPQVAGRPLRLHLLSPGRRVVAVTSDLTSFWTQGYPGVRSDLRGRYPRHDWPEDPRRGLPTARPKPRR